MWPVLAMAAGSYLMNDQNNQMAAKNNAAQAQSAAAQTQFSPWTHLGAGKANFQDLHSGLGAAVQGGITGASMSQAYDQAQSQSDMAKSQIDLNKAQQQYYTGKQAPQGQMSAWNRPSNSYYGNMG